jgi:hypothetical protein
MLLSSRRYRQRSKKQSAKIITDKADKKTNEKANKKRGKKKCGPVGGRISFSQQQQTKT